MVTLALILTLLAGAPQGREQQSRATPPPPCVPGAACCVWNLAGFCRVGCPPPHPVPVARPAPDVGKLALPHPNGVAILEIGVNEEGRVVSACVLRGLRGDFDAAAQQAALQSRWKPQLLHGRPVGAVMAVTFVTPMPGGWMRPAVTLKAALPITRGPITFVAPNAPCPPLKGRPVRLGTIVHAPLLEYVEPQAPSLLDVSGTVLLEALIAPDGRVTRITTLREVAGLTEPATDAARTWRFARTCVNGQPIPLINTIGLTYTIEPPVLR